MKWTHEAMLVAEGTPAPANLTPGETGPQALLKAGRNVLTARVQPAGNEGDVLFDLGIYAVATPVVAASLGEDVNQEVVMNTAVVCDMCSEQAGQRPACVNACPHEAAIRVNATTFFPVPST